MSSEITVVTSADDKFAVGLAGTIKSALNCLSPRQRLNLFVLDGGIADANRGALEEHWSDSRLSLHWVPVDRRSVASFVISDHVSDATYYRLLAPDLLPPAVTKFIFLDADLLIRRDLATLWDEPLNDLPCLAVQDLGAPFVDSRIALGPEPIDRGAIVIEQPIPNYEMLGLSPKKPYFNGGVMVIDLVRWRDENIAGQMLEVLTAHREHVQFWDQYALNVVLSGRWRQLSPLWNQNAIVYRYPGWRESGFCTREYPTYLTDPWIVHFNWLKPWQQECMHPFADDFLQHLAGSQWQMSIDRQHIPPPVTNRANSGPNRMKAFSRRLRRSFRSQMETLLRQRAA